MAARPPRRFDARAVMAAMAVLIAVQFVLGVVAITGVRFANRHPWHPVSGRPLFVLHGLVGVAVGAGALLALVLVHADRRMFLGAAAGLLGVLAGLGGGVLFAGTRAHLGGVILMFVGSLVAFCGYLLPLIEPPRETTPGLP